MDADYHYAVVEIGENFDEDSFDSVVFDPPFDQEQAREHYDGMHDTQRGPARRKLMGLVRPGGVLSSVNGTITAQHFRTRATDLEKSVIGTVIGRLIS